MLFFIKYFKKYLVIFLYKKSNFFKISKSIFPIAFMINFYNIFRTKKCIFLLFTSIKNWYLYTLKTTAYFYKNLLNFIKFFNFLIQLLFFDRKIIIFYYIPLFSSSFYLFIVLFRSKKLFIADNFIFNEYKIFIKIKYLNKKS